MNSGDGGDVVPAASVNDQDGRLTSGRVEMIVERLVSGPSSLIPVEVVGGIY